MCYQVTTALTPRQALEQALADFGPGGLGLQITSQTNLGLVFQGGGGHIAVTAQSGAETTLELETREWDYAVEKFMARVHRRRPWWQRWWRRQRPGMSRPGFVHRSRSLVGHHVYAEGRLLPPLHLRTYDLPLYSTSSCRTREDHDVSHS